MASTNSPPLPLTYADLVCLDDIDPFAAETTSDLQNLVQDVYHVLIQIPGSNPDTPDLGVGLLNFLGGTADTIRGVPAIIEEQLGRDDRISSVNCTIAEATPDFGETYTYIISLEIGVNGSVINLQYGWGPNQVTAITGGV